MKDIIAKAVAYLILIPIAIFLLIRDFLKAGWEKINEPNN